MWDQGFISRRSHARANRISWPIVAMSGTANTSGPLAFQINNSAWTPDGIFVTSLDASNSSVDLVWLPSSVPEPGTLGLTGLAVIGWVTYWRRRQSNAPAATLST